MMKKIKKNRFITLVSAIVIAICCVFPCFSGNKRIINGSADSFQFTDTYKALHGFNMLDPSIWNASTLFTTGFEQIPDKPVGCYRLRSGVTLGTNTWHYLAQYDLPSSLSIGDASDVRFNFIPVSSPRQLFYKIKVEYFGNGGLLGSYEVTSFSGVSNLPPSSVISGFRFYMMFDSSTDFSSVVFEPYLGSFQGAFIWQPYVNVGGIPQEELDSLLEEARNQGYEVGKEYAKSGYFNDITIQYVINTENGSLGGNSIKPDVLYDGISLTPLYEELYNYTQLSGSYPILSVDWSLHFLTPVPFSSLKFGLYSVVDYAQTTNSQGDLIYKRYTAEVIADSVYYIPARFVKVNNLPGYRLSLASTNDEEYSEIPLDIFNSQAFEVSMISGFQTLNINDFRNLQFIGLGNSNYQVGYDSGYNQANIDNQLKREEIFNAGKLVGQDIGYTQGALEGYAEGFAKASSSDPYSLKDFAFTLLDLPGRILYNWLNFDFFGFNVAGIVGLLISVVLIAYVWKKVV